MKKVLLLASMIGTFFYLGGCAKQQLGTKEENFKETEALLQFKTNFSNDFEKLDFSKTQLYAVSPNGTVEPTTKENANFQTIPVIENGKVVGRFIEINENGIFVDYRNYKSNIKAFNVRKPDENIVAVTKLDMAKGIYVPEFHFPAPSQRQSTNNLRTGSVSDVGPCKDPTGFNLCNAGCALSALAIAASDGPLPAMDILAVSYMATCTAGCGYSYCEKG